LGSINKVILIVLDSAGVGALPDAAQYGDAGAATLPHVLARYPELSLCHLRQMGLGNIEGMSGMPPVPLPTASWGRAATRSAGKDTLIGHWELMGAVTEQPFETFPNGFPERVMDRFRDATSRGILANVPASGTAIIRELGDCHVQTGSLIVYTSADSVFQIAAHEDVVPPEELYAYCRAAADILRGEGLRVGRIIARPFAGASGAYRRTVNRRDYIACAPKNTALALLGESGVPVVSVGKIEDIFAGTNFTRKRHTSSNAEGIAAVAEEAMRLPHGLIFANLLDFDMLYGHRRDAEGYGRALEAFDRALPGLLGCLAVGDALLITADHGCDPTHAGTDHTREYVPILLYRKGHREGHNTRALGTRRSLSDVGATVLALFGLPAPFEGDSFCHE